MTSLRAPFLPFRPPWQCYGIALLYAAGAVLLRWMLDSVLSDGVPLVTAYGFTALAVWHVGWRPALMTALVSFLAIDYLFMPPAYGLAWSPAVVWGFVAHCVSVFAIIAIGEAMRRAQLQARAAADIAIARQRALEREVAERTRMEERLRDREETLKTILNRTPFLLTRCSRDLRYLFVSQAYADMILRDPDELVGKPIVDVMGEDGFRTILPYIEQVLDGHCVQYEREVCFECVGSRWLHVNYTPDRNDQGDVIGWVASIVDITERKRAEEALGDSEKRLRMAQEGGRVGSFEWNMETGVNTWTPEFEAIYGFAPRQFGRTQRDWVERLHPDDRQRTLDAVEESARTGEPTEEEWRVVWPDGQVRWVTGRWQVLRDQGGKPVRMIGVNIDITDRKQADAVLRANEERLRLAMAAGNMGAWDIDLRTGLIVWDAKQHTLFGRSLDQTPRSLEEFYALVHPEDVVLLREAAGISELTGQFAGEFRVMHPGGTVRWMAGYGTTLHDDGGRPVRMVGINYDITDRKETERQLREREVQLKTFSAELEQLVAERTEDLVQSHARLRALAAELNLAEARERKRLATELHDHLQQLLVLGKLKLGQGKRLSQPVPQLAHLVEQTDDILTDALAYTRSLVAELSPPVLREHGLIAGLRWLGEWMRRHELEVAVEADHDMVVLLEDQSVLLFQSVRELLINAAKHAQCRRAVVRVTQGPRQLSITVKDDGTGFNLAAAAAAGAKGTGATGSSKFGIFSVRERMKAMGGALTIESAPGQGTTATLIMPLTVRTPSSSQNQEHEAPAVIAPAVGTGKGGNPRRTSKRIRVLLVDDHAMVRQGLRSVLDTHPDMEVVGEAWNGKEAVALVRKLQPAVVIMDINMPGMTGIEATANIKAEFPSVVVIGLSVNAEADNQEAMKRAGAEKLLTKEAAVDRLYQAIQSALKPASAGRRTPTPV